MRIPLPEKIKSEIPKPIWDIFNTFTEKGFEIYLIGGGTRNLLLGKRVENPDFTTNATPEEIQKLLPESFYDNAFGTVGMKVDEEVFEITTYRSESGYADKRHPDHISWGKTLEEDLSRREFTISAIAAGYNTEKDLELVDMYNGQEDLLKNKVIKAIGDPNERFSEDALRMIRAIRIAAQLSLQIEEKTLVAINKNAHLINQIANERIREEILKILSTEHPDEGFTLLLESGLLKEIFPELIKGYGLAQAKHHIYDVWTHSLMALKYCPSPDPIVRLATLLHDVGKPVVYKGEGENRTFYNHEVAGTTIVRNIADRLRFSKKDKERLILLVRWHQFTVDEHQTDSAIRRFIVNVGKENIQDMLDLRIGDRLGGGAKETSWRLEEFKQRIIEVQKQPFSTNDLKIDGNDIMEILKIGPGPKVGKILLELFNEVVEDQQKNTKEYLLNRIKDLVELTN